jgi:hypothetical protein
MGLISALLAQPRRFAGAGVNHEGERFTGRLEIEPLVAGRALLLRYTATRDDGRHLHAEATLLAAGADATLCLWPVMEELAFVLPHAQIHASEDAAGTSSAVFASGRRDAIDGFREEITIELDAAGQLVYAHAWGMPGGPFADRSRCTLAPALA